jgi:hypothetical protein
MSWQAVVLIIFGGLVVLDVIAMMVSGLNFLGKDTSVLLREAQSFMAEQFTLLKGYKGDQNLI